MNYTPEKISDKLRHARHMLEMQSRPMGESALRGSDGAVIQNFTTYARTYGFIEPLTGRELERAKSFSATVTHRITMRHLPEVKPQHQIKYGTRIFLITAVIRPNEVAAYLELYCEEFL